MGGTVLKWHTKGYGFASAGNKTVFIGGNELPDKNHRLVVGKTLTFDIEEVEGHDGRVLGRNVKGPAIVTWDDWKATYGKDGVSKDDYLAQKQAWNDHKDKQS